MTQKNRDEAEAYIKVIQAYLDGKKIQIQYGYKGEYEDIAVPIWAFSANNYRIKPEVITFKEFFLNTK